MDEFEIKVSKQEWQDFFVSKPWRKIQRELFDRIETNRDALEELRGDDGLLCQGALRELRWLSQQLPESLINEGEITNGGGSKQGITGNPGRSPTVPGRNY